MRRGWLLGSMFLALAWPAVTMALEVREFDGPEQERRYRALTGELRCTVCQNQNIADSGAELAADLRRKTYELLRAGKSDDEIRDYMVQRYGNFVLYDPPAEGGVLLLWAAPVVVLLLGGALLLRAQRRRSAGSVSNAVDESRLEAARRLLEGDKPEQK